MSGNPGSPDAGHDRRSEARQRAYKAGKIIFGNYSLSYDCLVRNTSPGGAKLQVDSNLSVPNEFLLYIPSDRLVGRVRVAWRSPKEIGVDFDEPMVDPRSHPDPHVVKLNLY